MSSVSATRLRRSFVLPCVAVGIILTGCTHPDLGAADLSSSATTICAQLWVDVYESSLRSDIADGESRRLADAARAECEGLGTTVPTIDAGPAVACAGDGDRRSAPPVSGDVKYVSVYFSCEADFATLGTSKQPLYMFTREIPGSMTDSVDGRVQAALRAYLRGPRPDEVDRGYFSAGAASLADDLADVSVLGGTATVDFDVTIEGHLGNLGTSTASQVFLLELQAPAFQFPEVKTLVLRVDGDCDRFWQMLEMSCRTVSRSG